MVANVRRFDASDYAVQEDDTLLVAYDEGAVYGLELAFPESDDDAYRVDLVRTTREANGAEMQQRLTLAEYPSQMEAEDHLMDASNALYENGHDSIAEHLPALTEQTPAYTAGFMVVSYPPDAVLTGESASVSIMALNRDGLQDALVGWNMPPHDASHLAMYLEDTQAEGGASALLQAATEEAQTRGMRQPDEPLFAASPHAPTTYLDQRAELDREAAIAADAEWGWHETRFAVLPPIEERETHQAALLDVYRDALSGDVAGSYLPISEHETATEAEQARDALIERAFEAHEDSSGWQRYAEAQVDDPIWQPMQPEHYELYEHISREIPEPDIPPDEQIDPLLAEATRLGAVVIELDNHEEQTMSNTLKAESQHWEVDLNEHITHLPPHVTAEYRTPVDQDGITPVRLRPEGGDSMYGFEVSVPDEQGAVTLAATKTFESEILHKPVTETAVLKTYRPSDYEESASYLNPRSDALSDARSLVYEWGRNDLDHGMGSALKLAQADGFKGEQLFAEGPADTFTPIEDARSVEVIQTERNWERDAEIFGAHGYKVPLPEETVHAREVGRYGSEADVPPGQFYAVTVREANLDVEAEPVYVIEGVKAWLDRENGEAELEAVALGVETDREDATTLANTVVDTPAVPDRLERMTELANDFAGRDNPHIEQLDLTVRDEGLFTAGPPDPQHPVIDDDPDIWEFPVIDRPGRLATPIGAYVDRHAGDYLLTDATVLPTTDHPAPTDEIEYQVLPLERLDIDPDEPHAPAEYDPVRMRPIEHGIPADHEAEYAFEVRHIRAFDLAGQLTDSYHVVEAVKAWHDPDILLDEDERMVLALPLAAFDEKESAFEVAEELTAKWWAEGVQPAMQDAANMAAGHLNPQIMDVENGHLFGMGPEDPFTVEFPELTRETEAPTDYTRVIGEDAYDLPLEEGQGYAFRARHLPVLEERNDAVGVDVMAVEAVKFWEADGGRQEQAITLGIYHQFDDRAAENEVDAYADLAEREGIQASMTRAAMLADVQNYPNMVNEAEHLGIHPNEDVRFGEMFSAGPDDPFLSEREINHIAGQYAQENPPHHQLSLEVVPVQDRSGSDLGHSVVALDATWDADEQPGNLEDASCVTAYELAQFETKAGADFYTLGLSEYMGKQDIEPQGTDISPAVNFVKAVQQTNGLADNERWLSPDDIAQIAKGEWTLQENPDDFNPITVEDIGAPAPVQVVVPDMDL